MNKKELIEKIESLPSHTSITSLRPYVDKKIVLGLINQLDEPEKVVIPKFVAEWYEEHKDNLEVSIFDYVYRINEKEESIFKKWFVDSTTRPFQILVNMHQFGYEVEKEPKYTVKVKATLGQYLGRYYLNNEELTPQFTRTQFTGKEKLPTFTRKELEEAGFGWVFDCEGIKIKEVE